MPPQTELSAGRVGALEFVTFPGEPGTLLAEELLGRLAREHGHGNVMFLGYTQDYTGYSILEDDWWQGGYEASGALWGPRQGAYLVDRAEEVFRRIVVDGSGADPSAPEPLPPFGIEDIAPYVPAEGITPGTIAADVAASYAPTDVITFTVHGSDPWLGAPVATLVGADGGPVLRSQGAPLTSDGYSFWVDLQPVPGYRTDRNATSRTFLWTFSLPAAQTVPDLQPQLGGGSYRLRAMIPTLTGDVEVESATFAVTP